MGRFVKGDVVVIPFPYSALSGAKKRPALVIAPLDGDRCHLMPDHEPSYI
jgi:mRNA interferase MazF